nr:DUF1572 family protein [uncultured Chryseobacterium sp.]
MITESLKSLFIRDLSKLKTEIESYQSEESLWKTDKDILNSAGNLCLHLVGNLNHFFGATLGNSGYVRNREEEFSLKNIPKSELIKQISETSDVIITTLDQLSDEALCNLPPLRHTQK